MTIWKLESVQKMAVAQVLATVRWLSLIQDFWTSFRDCQLISGKQCKVLVIFKAPPHGLGPGYLAQYEIDCQFRLAEGEGLLSGGPTCKSPLPLVDLPLLNVHSAPTCLSAFFNLVCTPYCCANFLLI